MTGCSIGLTGASVDSLALPSDAGTSIELPDASADAGGHPKKGTAPPANDAGGAAPDAGVRSVVSPLCGMTVDDGAVTCSPDEGSCTLPANDAGAGPGEGGADAGLYPGRDGGFTPSHTACRVMPVRGEAGSTPAPMCGVAGTGMSESACTGSSDCAPGFECVLPSEIQADGAASAGVCRQYCCSNVCSEAFFCSKQTTLGGAVAVPVCIPTQVPDVVDGGSAAPCQLLNDATCQYGQTCQVVPQATGQVLACVTPGTAMAGQSCESVNCAAGLSCIGGVFPYRTCAELCDIDEDQCPSGQTCTSNAVLSNVAAEVGICTD